MTDMPPLPPGFQLEDNPTTPPLPPGFVIQGSMGANTAPKPDEWRRATILPAAKNARTGEVSLAMPQIAMDLIDAIMLPGQVAKGEVDPLSEEGIGRSFDLAGLIMGGSHLPSGALVDQAGKTVPKQVVRALNADGVPLSEVGARVADLGEGAVVADLGNNLRGQAAAIATTPGAGQSTVVDALSARQAAAPERLTKTLDETLGPAPIPSYVQRDIKKGQRLLGPQYDEVLAGAGPVDTTPIASQLETAIPGLRGRAQSTLNEVRGMLYATGTDALDTSPATLFQVRRAIDGMLNGETDGNVISALTPIRKSIDEMLADKVPGIKGIDARYAELAHQADAVDRGQTVLGNSRTDPRPSELADEVTSSALPSGDIVMGPSGVPFRLRQGARAEIDRIVGTNLNDRAALNTLLKGNSDWNYERLTTLFGKEKTDELYSVLTNERAMAETENRALAGSKTAAVTAAQRDIDAPAAQPGAVRSALDLKFGSALANGVDRVFGGVGDWRRGVRNEDIADALMSPGNWSDPGKVVPMPTAALLQAIIRGRSEDQKR